jgi:ATP-dependent helicase/nuclease subunit A
VSLTAAQQNAVAARGNVLVVAGAGTGKTRTLVERCLNCLLEGSNRVSIDEILVVTFTEAAAAEIRQRIRARLEEECSRRSRETHWQEQLGLFESAHIGTLHSFCFQIVHEHFYELELDAQLSILPEEEARLLAEETLSELLQKYYAGRGKAAEAVQELIQAQAGGWDKPIRALILRLHDYTQTLPNPAEWYRNQLASFENSEPVLWQQWLVEGVADWRERWLPILQGAGTENKIAINWTGILKAFPSDFTSAQAAVALGHITSAVKACPRQKKKLWLEPFKEFISETEFLLALVQDPGKGHGDGVSANQIDPLTQDWTWVRFHMGALLGLAKEFMAAFGEAKRQLGVLDFHDLEQYALRLLWDLEANQPTEIARHWRQKLRFVFVDEYQDINTAQDQIITALSRDGAAANRFLVGDVKQSIYRFRLANPSIFQGYVEHWGKGGGTLVNLVENFRSRKGILDFVNSSFSTLMRRNLGGVEYDERAELRFGNESERRRLITTTSSAPGVELHVTFKADNQPQEQEHENTDSDRLSDIYELDDVEREAWVIGCRLQELRASQYPVWDDSAREFRPVDWRDMAILLRSPSTKAESYANAFVRLAVPLEVARVGFYRSIEVSDLLSLLQLLDNPLQDVPLLAVLHSPLVGLTANELALIRLPAPNTRFWTSLHRWEGQQKSKPQIQVSVSNFHADESAQDACPAEEGTHRKVRTFLERFGRWRRLARQVSLSSCLETVLSETLYADWLLTQPRGEQRYANVQRLITLAQNFDQFQRYGLFRFLRFIEAQQAAEHEPEVGAVNEENSVRLMSIHQSKGLEFPIVIVADLGKPFNFQDLHAALILDEKYGVCPQVKPPQTRNVYPSLPYWLARGSQKRELLGEELRLLYVAVTRARDLLLLSGAVAKSRFERVWKAAPEAGRPNTHALLRARSYADWLALWFSQNVQINSSIPQQGQQGSLSWFLHDENEFLAPQKKELIVKSNDAPNKEVRQQVLEELSQKLAWRYPFEASTRQPAKTSVTAVRRRANQPQQRRKRNVPRLSLKATQPHLSAADIGTAHHKFLRLVPLAPTHSVATLKLESERLQQRGLLSTVETAVLDFEGLAAFWSSELGRRVHAQQTFVQRELAFTARFAPNEIASLTHESPEPTLDQEFVVVQGVVDLAVVQPEGIWLLDFKTDSVEPDQLSEKAKEYEPQLKLYAKALSQIYQRPVSECWLYFLNPKKAIAVRDP